MNLLRLSPFLSEPRFHNSGTETCESPALSFVPTVPFPFPVPLSGCSHLTNPSQSFSLCASLHSKGLGLKKKNRHQIPQKTNLSKKIWKASSTPFRKISKFRTAFETFLSRFWGTHWPEMSQNSISEGRTSLQIREFAEPSLLPCWVYRKHSCPGGFRGCNRFFLGPVDSGKGFPKMVPRFQQAVAVRCAHPIRGPPLPT